MRLNRTAFLFLLVASTASLLAQTKSAPFESEINAFEASDKTNPPPKGAIVFIGSSSIRMWNTLAHDFPQHRVLNRGFGGSQIIDSVNYAARIVTPYEPKQIVLYAGGNDINAGKSPEQIFNDFKSFLEKVRTASPGTPVAYISIAPNPARWSQIENIKAANNLIADYIRQDSKLTFINVFAKMLGEDGKPRPEIFGPDRLHMNARGYELWTSIVRPYLKQ